jgi:DNA-binding PucR family transcriptional regulator
MEDDAANGGVLATTVLAYADAGLQATAAAERLFVHVNTVQYRLRRIAERTGCNLRHLPDVLELVLAARRVGDGVPDADAPDGEGVVAMHPA